MRVLFIRHGRADWPGWRGSDDQRPLNDQGIRETLDMARLVRKLGGEPQVILTSPLPRAEQTANIIGEELGAVVEEKPALSPGCSEVKLRMLLKKHKGKDLVLVGHQPDFSALIKALTGARVRISKSGVARVDLDEELIGKLIWLLPAKLVEH